MLSLMTLDLELNMYHAAALGAALFYLGTEVVKHVPFFQTCDTLVSLLGGLLFAFLNTVLYACGLPYFTFDTTLQTVFMNLFFASIGFSFSLPSLLCGGRAAAAYLLLGAALTVAQTLLGAGVMLGLGQDPRLGLALGSISLISGPGIAAALGPALETAGCAGGSAAGLSAAALGLVAGSILSGSAADQQISKCKVLGRRSFENSSETAFLRSCPKRYVIAFMLVLFSAGFGDWASATVQTITGIPLPSYIGGMLVAMTLRNMMDAFGIHSPSEAMDSLGYMTLSIFLAMAMMTSKLWELADLAFPIIAALTVQLIFLIVFFCVPVFRVMGKGYGTAGTAGVTGLAAKAIGSAMGKVQAAAHQYGPSSTVSFPSFLPGRAYVDFVMILVTGLMIPMLGLLP